MSEATRPNSADCDRGALTYNERRRWTEVAERDGWEGITATALWHRAVEAVAWELIEQTMDTADREPGVETVRSAYATARALLASLRVTPPGAPAGGEGK